MEQAVLESYCQIPIMTQVCERIVNIRTTFAAK